MLKESSVKIILIIVAAFLFVNVVISCSGDSSTTSNDTKTQSSSATQMKPSEVVTAAYMAANEEKYAEAEKYLSSEAKTAIQEATELAGGIKDVWDTKTRNATIEGIEITQQDVRGEKATIAILIHFKDGSISNQHESLIIEGGQWKMTL
jgi:hypothetical protein